MAELLAVMLHFCQTVKC